ncbi:type III pantothenate kinase [bacterium]|nr:type III pantothenate kinase [bacterium]
MFLAIDVGNTHTTLGLMDDTKVLREWRITTSRHQTADELQITLRFLGGIDQVPAEEWRGAALCSVVPSINTIFARSVKEVIGIDCVVLSNKMDLGLKNEYEHPEEVGMDRLANAVAGIDLHGPGLAIVDFGTATTIDVISREGNYLGGVIMPGLEATADALHIRTSKLPRVRIERPRGAVGRTTVQSMLAGLFFGSIDGVEGCVRRIESELGYELKLIATGGLANVLGPDMTRLAAVEPNLTLLGIEKLWRRNWK